MQDGFGAIDKGIAMLFDGKMEDRHKAIQSWCRIRVTTAGGNVADTIQILNPEQTVPTR